MPFSDFLQTFIPKLELKSVQLNKATWILETTGLEDACDLKATLDTELRLLFHDKKSYEELLSYQKENLDPIHKRKLSVLIRAFKQNQIDESLLKELAQKEAALSQSYASFRPILNGKPCSENEIREILKKEEQKDVRKHAWLASKEIGKLLAPQILALVAIRNKAAKSLGYNNYFEMQLDLQEVDDRWLSACFDELATKSDAAYSKVVEEIEAVQAKRFGVSKEELGPWAWVEPFCQEDPLNSSDLDSLVAGTDIVKAASEYFTKMGFDVTAILARSDMEERPLKNQHAFCINIDRKSDVRTLNNIKPTMKWYETVLHELGHAVYELGFDEKLPWLLREPPHMIPTEAMALLMGRQAYKNNPLAERSLKRRQLIFSRWVLVMTAFERELYKDPKQDLNTLWWHLVEKYQKVRAPKERKGKDDWATKYHIALAPVYYFSYLVGELFASSLEETFKNPLPNKEAGDFLQKRLFAPGNSMSWSDLIIHVTGHPLKASAWLQEFA